MASPGGNGGGSPRNGSSRSSGGHHGRPSCWYKLSSFPAAGSPPSASTYAREPVARRSSVPKRAGSATTSSTGTPSTVSPTQRRSARSTTVTISGDAANASMTSPGSAAAETTARSNDASAH